MIPSRTGYARSGSKSNPNIHAQSRTGREDGRQRDEIVLTERFAGEEDEGKIRTASFHEARLNFPPSDDKVATTTVDVRSASASSFILR